MILSILDYTTEEVIIENVPKLWEHLDGDEIVTNMGYKLSNINYMITKTLNLKVNYLQ